MPIVNNNMYLCSNIINKPKYAIYLLFVLTFNVYYYEVLQTKISTFICGPSRGDTVRLGRRFNRCRRG